MASQLNRAFFKEAKKVDRAIEIRDNEAIIPAVKDKTERRAKLPNRRLLTIDERKVNLQERAEAISALEEEIEVERKTLLESVKSYEAANSGAASVVAQNLKVKGLMEKRSRLSYPEKWIESLGGLSLKDIFASKRDVRKIGSDVEQIKRRVEPITSLYVDLDAAAAAAEASGVATVPVASLVAPVASLVAAPVASLVEPVIKTAEQAAQGVIIGQKRVIKTKKIAATAPAGPTQF